MLTLSLENKRTDGSIDWMNPIILEAKDAPLWWQVQGLSYTATGYGKRIPTSKMVRYMGKWRRVYCAIFSNAGTCYIGKLSDKLFIN